MTKPPIIDPTSQAEAREAAEAVAQVLPQEGLVPIQEREPTQVVESTQGFEPMQPSERARPLESSQEMAPAQRSLRRKDPQAQPRERLQKHGAGVLTDAELLAVLLGTGTAGQPVDQLALALIDEFGSLRRLLGASSDRLLACKGLGQAKSAQLQAILELARRCLREELQSAPQFEQPQAVRRYLQAELAHRDIEICLALHLDSRHRLLGVEEISRGTLNQATVYPREVVRSALRMGTGAMVLAHNHPSGDPEPSAADRNLTQVLKRALATVDVALLDHFVIAGQHAVSLAERGWV